MTHVSPLPSHYGLQAFQPPAPQPQWFAIWTRSRHEQVVREHLEAKNIETLLPTVVRWSRWTDRRKRVVWPLFPCYCFARFDPADSLAVLTCSGVLSIVSFAGKPAPVPEHELEMLRVLMGKEMAYDAHPLLVDGMRVQVIAGPLLGVAGTLLRKDDRRASVVLSVDAIGQGVRVEIAADDVAPCEDTIGGAYHGQLS